MKRITLPIVAETASVAEGWQALRHHGVHAVVAQSGSALWLHQDTDLAAAMEEHRDLALGQTNRRSITVLGPNAGEQEIRVFLENNPHEQLVATAMPRDFAGLMHFFVLPESPLGEVEVKAWHCPANPNEVSTTRKYCGIHQRYYVQDV